jgi:hypothetical protein
VPDVSERRETAAEIGRNRPRQRLTGCRAALIEADSQSEISFHAVERWENDRDIVRDAQGRIEGVHEHATPCYLDDGRMITADLDAPDIIGVFPCSAVPRSALAAALFRLHTYATGDSDEPRKSRRERRANE